MGQQIKPDECLFSTLLYNSFALFMRSWWSGNKRVDPESRSTFDPLEDTESLKLDEGLVSSEELAYVPDSRFISALGVVLVLRGSFSCGRFRVIVLFEPRTVCSLDTCSNSKTMIKFIRSSRIFEQPEKHQETISGMDAYGDSIGHSNRALAFSQIPASNWFAQFSRRDD